MIRVPFYGSHAGVLFRGGACLAPPCCCSSKAGLRDQPGARLAPAVAALRAPRRQAGHVPDGKAPLSAGRSPEILFSEPYSFLRNIVHFTVNNVHGQTPRARRQAQQDSRRETRARARCGSTPDDREAVGDRHRPASGDRVQARPLTKQGPRILRDRAAGKQRFPQRGAARGRTIVPGSVRGGLLSVGP
jgi:hypothetical protein